jgi:hypothetical protein
LIAIGQLAEIHRKNSSGALVDRMFIEYDVTGKVTGVYGNKVNGQLTGPVFRYVYDDRGFRSQKAENHMVRPRRFRQPDLISGRIGSYVGTAEQTNKQQYIPHNRIFTAAKQKKSIIFTYAYNIIYQRLQVTFKPATRTNRHMYTLKKEAGRPKSGWNRSWRQNIFILSL